MTWSNVTTDVDAMLADCGQAVICTPTVNGTFSSDWGWTKGTGWTITGGKATCGTHTGTSDLKQNQVVTSGTPYTVAYTVSGRTAGTITPYLGGTAGTARSTNASFSETIVCGAGTDPRLVFTADASFNGSLDSVSVGSTTVYAIVRAVDELLLEQSGHGGQIGRQVMATMRTGAASVAVGTSVIVDGTEYTVRERLAVDDGNLTKLLLQAVA